MILSVFKSRKKDHPETDGLASGLSDTSSESGLIDQQKEVELRLERELAVALARKPLRRRTQATPSQAFIEDDPPFFADPSPAPADGDGDGQSGANSSRDAEPEDVHSPGQQPVQPRATASTEDAQQRWLIASRRNRRALIMRKAGSFIITLTVTAFIVSLTAIFLFGLPEQFAKLGAPAEVEDARYGDPLTGGLGATKNDPAAAPVRLQWVSK